jgi:hypothetical protein
MLTIDDLKADRPAYDPTAARYRELESRLSALKDAATAIAAGKIGTSSAARSRPGCSFCYGFTRTRQ